MINSKDPWPNLFISFKMLLITIVSLDHYLHRVKIRTRDPIHCIRNVQIKDQIVWIKRRLKGARPQLGLYIIIWQKITTEVIMETEKGNNLPLLNNLKTMKITCQVHKRVSRDLLTIKEETTEEQKDKAD